MLCEFYNIDHEDEEDDEKEEEGEDQTEIVRSILNKTVDDFQSSARQLPPLKRLNYQQQDRLYCLLVETESLSRLSRCLVFIAVGTNQVTLRLVYLLLEDLRQRWHNEYSISSSEQSPAPLRTEDLLFSPHQDFANVIAERLRYHEEGKTGDAIALAQHQIHEVRSQMSQNIDLLLERQDKIEDLVNKTENLQSNTKVFKSKAAALSKKRPKEVKPTVVQIPKWWASKQILLLLLFMLLTTILASVMTACGGPSFELC
eukprot:TRINITY_DN11579_c0_g1_i1.p1 TRINITY_DN11579_c0_g1~~TRINITY_DN11579_c0_g1_i1.p1  ORF type:complete len:286 (-),score=78.54 TRINITY_DN11579_c0_g1_i1:70-843(-)